MVRLCCTELTAVLSVIGPSRTVHVLNVGDIKTDQILHCAGVLVFLASESDFPSMCRG
jgi:hypothetical protein